MNKFIILKTIKPSIDDSEIAYEDSYYIINVSQVVWIHPKKYKSPKLDVYYDCSVMKFSDGSKLVVKHSNEEILTMMLLKPWWKNLIDAIRMLFIKKHKKS